MLVRQNAQDYDVKIFYNKSPGMKKFISKDKQLTYPNSKKYFLLVDGAIVKKSDSFKTIEEEYVKEVAKKTDTGFGRFDIVKHKLINNKVNLR